MDFHRLTGAQLDDLASGTGSVSAIEEISTSRISLHVLLLKLLAERWTGDRGPLDAAVTVLAEAQERRPEIYRDMLGDPMAGAWLTAAVSRDVPRTSDLLEVGNLAAAAAMRAGLSCRLTVGAHAGRVVLPTLGSTRSDGSAEIVVEDGRSLVTDDPSWLSLRRLHARHDDLKISVRFDDASAYRDGYHAPPAERLSDAEMARWQDLFDDAWTLLARHAPAEAAEIVMGLRVLVPLVDLGDGASRSGTARSSVGAMGLTMPRSAEDFAVTLVHEFAHSKLSGVLDLMPLYRPDGNELHHAPWRRDKRPTSGLIQGVFAFLRVAETWHRFRAIPGLTETATTQFAVVRDQVRDGYEALAASKELTPTGVRFVAAMRPTLDRLISASLETSQRQL